MTMSPAPPFAHGTNCGKLRGTWTFVVFVTACARADVGTASTRTKITVSVRFFTIANPVMVASSLPSEIGERNSVWGLRLCRRVPASEQRGPLDGAKPLGKDGRCQAHFSSRQLTTNAVGWLESEIEGWIATRVSRRERHPK